MIFGFCEIDYTFHHTRRLKIALLCSKKFLIAHRDNFISYRCYRFSFLIEFHKFNGFTFHLLCLPMRHLCNECKTISITASLVSKPTWGFCI